MSFKLTAGQEAAFKMVKQLRALPHDRAKVGVLRGVAGVGKTTMLRVIGEDVGGVTIIAPTGKAAVRVTEATGLSASTIHKFLYAPKEDPLTGEVRFQRKDLEEIPAPESKLIIIEESSMVGEKMWEDIYDVAQGLGCHLLCVGDPFQLPPVEEGKSFGGDQFGVLLPNFRFDLDATLTEITRQALDSPIIRASMKLRSGDADEAIMELDRIRPADIGTAHLAVLEKNGVLICHRNVTRAIMNSRVREARKLPDHTLAEGEPLLVLRNNYGLNRFNGEVLRFDEWKRPPGKQWEVYDRYKQTTDKTSFGLGVVEGQEVSLSPKAIMGGLGNVGVSAVEYTSQAAIGKNIPYLHCGLGYTLTAHKSQGSEFKDVVVVVEQSVKPFTMEGRRWLYTSLTRAKERVAVCWMPTDAELGLPRKA